jgi:hypothetical protein
VSFGAAGGVTDERTFAKIGETVMEGRDYTDSDMFEIDFGGSGLYALLICVSPERVWDTEAETMAKSNATFTPGGSVYLS